jgi:hypothetical protein
MDIACSDRMIAVECDRPSHNLVALGDVDRREHEPTKAKRRLLHHLVGNVVNLNWANAHQQQMSVDRLRDELLA